MPKKVAPPEKIKKRDGRIVPYNTEKIAAAIWKAARAIGGRDRKRADFLADQVEKTLAEKFGKKSIPNVEQIQDIVEKTLVENSHYRTAKAYILYRDLHQKIRDIHSLVDSDELLNGYLQRLDWKINENSNMSYSLQGLNNYVASAVSSNYWLNKIHPREIRNADTRGDFHIHDLQLLSAYCCGWDLQDLLLRGFGGVPGKLESKPPKHFRTALLQAVNFFYTLQGETAGAQAFSNFDTLLAPLIRYDNLSYPEVKQSMQEFIFNMNVPTRVGFQTPFTNITLDLKPSSRMACENVIIGGVSQYEKYGDFQKEIDMFNKAFAEIMLEGDAKGRVFTFPIPTYNIARDFDWDNEKLAPIWEMTAKYGIPYFSNFINSDMDVDDARSMCCRLRIDNRELRKKGGGLFGANPLTGSIGVVTLNLARLGFLSKTKDEFFERLSVLMDLAKESLMIKRRVLESFTDDGLYPYSRYYLQKIKDAFGGYWKNHFNTIGINGMNEALVNLFGENITESGGRSFALEVLDFMREKISDYQTETGEIFNLEATPAEGTSYRFPLLDKKYYPKIAGNYSFYTNSTFLPVDHTDDLFEALSLQDELQVKYTGGTVFHGFLGERLPNGEAVKMLVKKIAENYSLPYYTLTPTFSICPNHGYIKGEEFTCPQCGASCEVYSRVVGYLRPVQQWNKGKQAEFSARKTFAF